MEVACTHVFIVFILFNTSMVHCILLEPQTTSTPNPTQSLVNQGSLALLTSDMNKLRSDMLQMNTELKSTVSQVQVMTQENQLLKTQVLSLTQENQLQNLQVQNLTQENELLRNAVSKLQNETEGSLRNDVIDLTDEMSDLKTEFNNSEWERNQLNSSLLQIKDICDGAGSVVFRLQFKGDWTTIRTLHTVLKFDNVIVNVGGGYNATTGIFTCPTAGLYLLSLRCTVDWRSSGLSVTHTYLHRNKDLIMDCVAASVRNRQNDFVQIPTYLNKGDQLSITANLINGMALAGSWWTYFSGILLALT